MCITLFTHNTSIEHESRWVSVINPATGYAVRSPFQHPFYKTCQVSCIREPILPHRKCHWHHSCCRLDYQLIPCINRSQCTRPEFCVHLYEGEFEKLPLGFLDYLGSCDPLFLDTITMLFLTGIELSLSTLFQMQLTEILLNSSSNKLSSTDKAYIETRAGCFGHYADKTEEFLGQLARFFDLQNENELFLPRPGKENQPELNLIGSNFPFLKVVSWLGSDNSPNPWPNNVVTWPNIGDLIIRHSSNCSHVPWASGLPIEFGDTIISVEHLVPLPSAISTPGTNCLSSQSPPSSLPRRMKLNTDQARGEDWVTQFQLNNTHTNSVPDIATESFQHDTSYVTPQANGRDIFETSSTQQLPLPHIEPNPDVEMSDVYDSSLDANYNVDFDSSAQNEATNSDDSSYNSKEEEDEDEDEDEEDTYLIEDLLSHRPPITDRSKVISYKVRWCGDCKASEKETWEPAVNIAVDLVDSYWADFESGKQRRARSARS